jgi:hypothetical protein
MRVEVVAISDNFSPFKFHGDKYFAGRTIRAGCIIINDRAKVAIKRKY